jgi:predicted negative regulator of RcsB-dependent stress response
MQKPNEKHSGLKQTLMELVKSAETRSKQIILGLILLIGVGAGIWFYQKHQQEQLSAASDLLYQAQEFYNTQFDQIRSEVKRQDQEALPQSFLGLEKKYLAVIEAFPNTAQAQLAAMDLSKAYYDLNQIEKAKHVLDMVNANPALMPLFYIRKAFYEEASADFPASKKMWQHVLSDQKNGKPFHGIAKVHLARIEYQLKNSEEGKFLLDEVIQNNREDFEAIEAEKIKLYYD